MGQEEILVGFEAAALQNGLHDLFGGAGIGGGLQADELAGPQVLTQGLGHADDVLQVGRQVLGQGRGHRDDDDIQVLRAVEGDLGAQTAALDRGPQVFLPDVVDVVFAPVDLGHPLGVALDAQHLEPGLSRLQREGQPDIAQAHDADAGGVGLNLLQDARQIYSAMRGGHKVSPFAPSWESHSSLIKTTVAPTISPNRAATTILRAGRGATGALGGCASWTSRTIAPF